ncbi:zinc finger CCCH domain-containing protein 20 [Nicotiana tabacum]|uniref:Zinc finger CCCH domain-containing protein 20 n=1 Tax=Nicotiana tabacum TaxID=4097 RepID=A0A1S4BGJ1_TOBAC|nr:zinc finger CCCH domain-containing protein 20-like [Nicotiana tomentosiformis]XP_016487977.1 PREDICTED: zinc finger CCCH domain-containing protein 20-like [Nicotiana tabacum]
MMMIGRSPHSHPTVQVPPWDVIDDPTVDVHSPFSVTPNNYSTSPDSGFDALTALHRYLPSNANDVMFDSDGLDIPVDAFSCDNFRMYEFKVRKCARGRSHDWTECPYAHPGEKARRRDPRKYFYSGTACPDFRKGLCKKGDACEYAHGVFECWLHPARYRTQPCKDGTHCRRRVCFFAHTPEQLRVLPQNSPRSYAAESCDSFDGSPSRLGFDSFSSSPPFDSPPMTPSGSLSLNSVNGLAESMRNMQIGMVRGLSSPTWGLQMGSPGFGSSRSPSMLRPGFMSLPTTPTRNPTRSGLAVFDQWEKTYEEEPTMERVESGRDLRARIYAKLSMENSLDSGAPDVGWVSELLK